MQVVSCEAVTESNQAGLLHTTRATWPHQPPFVNCQCLAICLVPRHEKPRAGCLHWLLGNSGCHFKLDYRVVYNKVLATSAMLVGHFICIGVSRLIYWHGHYGQTCMFKTNSVFGTSQTKHLVCAGGGSVGATCHPVSKESVRPSLA